LQRTFAVRFSRLPQAASHTILFQQPLHKKIEAISKSFKKVNDLGFENGRRRRLLSGVFRRWKRSLNAQQAEAQAKIRRVRIFAVVRQRLRETFSVLK